MDDIAFDLADRRILTVPIQDATACVKEVRMEYKKKVIKRAPRSNGGVSHRRP